jgi:hypothetical protein
VRARCRAPLGSGTTGGCVARRLLDWWSRRLALEDGEKRRGVRRCGFKGDGGRTLKPRGEVGARHLASCHPHHRFDFLAERLTPMTVWHASFLMQPVASSRCQDGPIRENRHATRCRRARFVSFAKGSVRDCRRFYWTRKCAGVFWDALVGASPFWREKSGLACCRGATVAAT